MALQGYDEGFFMRWIMGNMVGKDIILVVALGLALNISGGCRTPLRTFVIGIAGHSSIDTAGVKGFKAGMAELGYVEGQNIKYIFKSVLETDIQDMDNGIRELLSQDIDLLLTTGEMVSVRANGLVKGTAVPLLFIGNSHPVENGLVATMSHPGGYATGVRVVDNVPKALEFLVMVTPGAKKVYLPYDPKDDVTTVNLPVVSRTASQLGIEVVFQEIHSIEDAVKGIEALPDDVNAIFCIPSRTLNAGNIELSRAAIRQGKALGAAIALDEEVLVTFSTDFFDTGKKAARLAQQVLNGVRPADIPVESSEVYLTINLKTAEKIGIKIPNSILAQANKIIR